MNDFFRGTGHEAGDGVAGNECLSVFDLAGVGRLAMSHVCDWRCERISLLRDPPDVSEDNNDDFSCR